MTGYRALARLALLLAPAGILACHDATGPRQPATAITYVRSSPLALVVSRPDGKQIYQTYPLPFLPNEVALSPDHSQIVMSNDGFGELWVETTTDGQTRMIVGPDSGAAMPSWSPDGKHILFYRTTNGGAWVIDPDGSNEHPIASGPPAYPPEFDPVWSPDGSQIAFDGPYDGASNLGLYHLYVMNADGTGAHVVSIPQGNTVGDAWQPAWSADGRQLAFVRDVDTTTAIWIANVDGSGARPITNEQDQPWQPTWSPTGDEIAFAVFFGSPEHVVTLNISTGVARHLPTGTAVTQTSPHWIRWP